MKLFRLNPYFFGPFLLALLIGAVILIVTSKGAVLLFVNQNHYPMLDLLFYYGTSLGNGLLYVIVICILAGINYGSAFIALLSFLQTVGIVLFLKGVVFHKAMRPKRFFEGIEELQFLEGVVVHSYHSFPSGHTATAFSLFCLLSLLIPNKKIGLVLITLALIAGISRIYLVQHFFIDVYVGAIIGVVISTLTYYYVHNSNWYQVRTWRTKKLEIKRPK